MKNAVLFLTVIALLALGCAQTPTGAIADTIYINGRIYTVNEAQPWAEAVAISDGRVAPFRRDGARQCSFS